MKKTITYIAMIAITGTTLTSCGIFGGTGNPRGQRMDRDRCEQMADDLAATNLRAHGLGNSQDESFARDIAATTARNQLAASIASGIVSTLNNFRSQQEGQLTQRQQQDIIENVNEILRGARIVCTEMYHRPAKRKNPAMFTASVCVEIDIQRILQMQALTSGAPDVVTQMREDFLQRMKNEREDYQRRRNQQRERDGF